MDGSERSSKILLMSQNWIIGTTRIGPPLSHCGTRQRWWPVAHPAEQVMSNAEPVVFPSRRSVERVVGYSAQLLLCVVSRDERISGAWRCSGWPAQVLRHRIECRTHPVFDAKKCSRPRREPDLCSSSKSPGARMALGRMR